MSYQMLIYMSQATRHLSSEEVEQIAILSAVQNQRIDVTGLLLQIGNYFVQVLEGSPRHVAATMEKIDRDSRHEKVRVIYMDTTDGRHFPHWNMACFNIERHYQINRLDFMDLQRYVGNVFASRDTSMEALLTIIKSIPWLMEAYEVK